MQLRQLKLEDAELMIEWMHDPEINCNFRFNAASYTIDMAEAFIKRANKEFELGQSYHFAITENGNEYLGTISLKNVNRADKNAEYAVCLRKCATGKGLARQATREILKYAFEMLDLNKVYLNVLAENQQAMDLYESSGFKFEGEWKKHIFISGRWHSLRWYSILKEEWKEL